jgi:hypothetical protein
MLCPEKFLIMPICKIKSILVKQTGNGLQIMQIPNPIEVEADSNTVLELVRLYFKTEWRAKVHALRWIRPGDLLLEPEDPSPWLVLYVDEPGKLSPQENGGAQPAAAPLSTILMEATRACNHQSWSEPTWLENVSLWVKDNFGFDPVQYISQIRTTTSGAVLRIQCRHGVYYLKTLPAFFSYEPKLLAVLDAKAPGACPDVLPIQPDPNSHITSAVAGKPLRTTANVDHWKNALRDLARIQFQSVDHVEEIRASGIPYQSFSSFASSLDRVLARLVGLQVGAPNELNSTELEKVPTLVNRAADDCDVLAQCQLPDAIIHGDWNEHNVFWTETGNTRFIDWTFSRVGHPFFALSLTLSEAYNAKHRMHAVREELARVYLDEWREYACLRRLRVALDAAFRLQWIETVESVTDYLQSLMKEEPGNIAYIPFFLRRAFSSFSID